MTDEIGEEDVDADDESCHEADETDKKYPSHGARRERGNAVD